LQPAVPPFFPEIRLASPCSFLREKFLQLSAVHELSAMKWGRSSLHFAKNYPANLACGENSGPVPRPTPKERTGEPHMKRLLLAGVTLLALTGAETALADPAG
jgi:hypothetical protein